MTHKAIYINGASAAIYFHMTANGRMPGAKFLKNLSEKEREKLIALFERAAAIGPQSIRNNTKVKKVARDVFEFKGWQARMFFCYGKPAGLKTTVILLNGVVKKTNRLRPRDIEKAQRLALEARNEWN